MFVGSVMGTLKLPSPLNGPKTASAGPLRSYQSCSRHTAKVSLEMLASGFKHK